MASDILRSGTWKLEKNVWPITKPGSNNYEQMGIIKKLIN
jgi:hypothetical protein